MNNISITGRLTRKPELKSTQSGEKVVNFTVAVQRNYKSNGEYPTDFIDCVAWRGTAETVAKYFEKGSQIGVTGSLESRKYVDTDGNNRTKWEVKVNNIDFLDSRKKEENDAPVDTSREDLPF